MNTHFTRLGLIVALATATGCSILGKAENDYIGNTSDTGPDATDADVGDSNVDAPDTVACGDCADPSRPLCRVVGAIAECVECLGDTDCASGNCDEDSGTCGPCSPDSCDGLACDASDGTCVECFDGPLAVTCDTPGDFCVDRACMTCTPACTGDTICALDATGALECAACDADGDGFPREECGERPRTETRDAVPVDCNDEASSLNPGLICGSCGGPDSIFGAAAERHGIARRVATGATRELKIAVVESADEDSPSTVQLVYLTDAVGPGAIQHVVATPRDGTLSIAEPVPVMTSVLGTMHPTTTVDAMDAVANGAALSVAFIEENELFIADTTTDMGVGTRDISEPALSMFATASGVTVLGRRNPTRYQWVDVSGPVAGGFMQSSVVQFDAAGDSVAFRFADSVGVGHRNDGAAVELTALTELPETSTHLALVETSERNRSLLYITAEGAFSARFSCDGTGCGSFPTTRLGDANLIEGAFSNERFAIISRDGGVALNFLTALGNPAMVAGEWPTTALFAERLNVINDIAVDVAPVLGGTLVAIAASGTPPGGGVDEIWMTTFVFCE